MVQAAQTALVALLSVLDSLQPMIESAAAKGQQLWQQMQPYAPQDFAPTLLGTVLVLYGGQFPVLIAACEAFRLTGW
jgi:hypothetical protein